MRKSKASRKRVSKKIEYLIGEGKSPDQAVAMALSMEREGRLTDTGAYIPVKKKKKHSLKTASAEAIDAQHHIAHFKLIDGEEEYVDEEYQDNNENPIDFALRVVLHHKNMWKNKLFFMNDKKTIVIKDDSDTPNLFILKNFTEEEIEQLKRKIA